MISFMVQNLDIHGGFRVRVSTKAVAATVGAIAVGCVATAALRFVGSLDKYCSVYRTDKRKEVLYRLGSPQSVLGEPEKGPWGLWQRVYVPGSTDPKQAMPPGKSEDDFSAWAYTPADDVTITVSFDKSNRVESISCMTGHENACPNLAGVAFGDTEEQVFHKLGRYHVRYKLDGVSKTVRYDDLGVEYVLTKDRVYTLTLLATPPSLVRSVLAYVLNIPRRLTPG